MSKYYLFAGIASLALLALHIIGGEFVVHRPLLQSTLSIELKAFSSVLWHVVTAMIAFNTAALFWIVRQQQNQKPLALLVTAQYGATAIVFMSYGMLRHGSLLPMPQWSLFLLTTFLILVALRKDQINNRIGDLK